jgi:hypothetical protein
MSQWKGHAMFSLRTLEEHADWLRAYLAKRGVAPVGGSAFAEGLGALERLGRLAQTPAPHPPMPPMPPGEFLKLMRDAMGTDWLIDALRRSQRWLDSVDPERLRVLRGPDINLMRAAAQSGDRDVSWELLVGALVSTFARDVDLVEPPDLRCTYGGAKWGLAAKILYSGDPNRHIDRIVEGAKQIERSDADVGLVIVNGVNLVPHDELFHVTDGGLIHNFNDAAEPKRMLRDAADRFFKGINTPSILRRLTAAQDAGRPPFPTGGLRVPRRDRDGLRGPPFRVPEDPRWGTEIPPAL